jgi:tight adherence protein B
MEIQFLIIIAVFGGVAALVGGCSLLFAGRRATSAENRLEVLAAAGGTGVKRKDEEATSLLARPLDETMSYAEVLFSRFGNIRVFLDQADMSLKPQQFLLISLGLGALGAMICIITKCPMWAAPLAASVLTFAPAMYALFKRKRRMAAFTRQLPDALELISRALRAGHSLAAGFSLAGEEMPDPVSTEFTRCYEEQNLGIPLEEALTNMTERVPSLDLRFFATAVILQRQTGGDLAEILDKIGSLVRERFKIWGQIQALTGEGRLSGIVLLALPPVLFVVMYRLNPEYCMVLFKDPLGQWMLAGAVIMQLFGALVIRKIINIKV